MLSRNFRLQKIGDINWLQKNYDFSKISFFIDELVVLNVSRNQIYTNEFLRDLEKLTYGCFVPITAGGGIRSMNCGRDLLNSGADKIVVNTPIFENKELVENLSIKFGQQCIVASIDLKRKKNFDYEIYSNSGMKLIDITPNSIMENLNCNLVGELYLNSIDQDGTGQGFDLDIIKVLPMNFSLPIILAGGAGNANHIIEALKHSRIDAVATANLLNFVGDGLKSARKSVVDSGIKLAYWPSIENINKSIKS